MSRWMVEYENARGIEVKSYGRVGEDYEEELMSTGRGGSVVDFRSAPTAVCYDPELRSPRVCA